MTNKTDLDIEAYTNGYQLGEYKLDHSDYDPRWDFADAAKAGKPYFAQFKRGFTDGYEGAEESP